MTQIETHLPPPIKTRHTVRYTYAELVELLKREHPEAQGHKACVCGLEQSSYQGGDARCVTLAWDVEEPTDER
jgi:hypothetical protein